MSAGPRLPARYVELTRLGEGGMGIVWRARDRELQRTVAVKCAKPELQLDSGARERFRREVLAMQRVKHANVVRLLDGGDCEGSLYLSMEYLEGETLRRLMDLGLLDPRQIVRWFVALCDGLGAVHAAGLVHRDLKPANLLVRADGTPTLMDFGLVRFLDDDERTALTRTGQLVGTRRYLPPESLEGARLDARSDVYQLAVVLHEALAGRLPPVAVAVAERMGLAAPLARDALPSSAPGVPPGLSAVLERALAQDPARRTPSATDLRDGLAEWLAASPAEGAPATPAAPAPTAPEPASRRLSVAAAFVAGALLGSLVLGAWLPRRAGVDVTSLAATRLVPPDELAPPTRASADDLGWTPLHHAAWGGQTERVLELLGAGATAGATEAWGWTPLHLAAGRGHRALADLLLAKGAPVDPRDRLGRTPLRWAAEAGRRDLAELLLERGAAIGAPDAGGRTALHGAALRGRTAVVELLARWGAPVDAADGAGQTALHLAAYPGNLEAVRALVAAGARVDVRDARRQTPLFVAVRGNQVKTALGLLDAGADPNLADREACSPLWQSGIIRSIELTERLLAAGADPAFKNVWGETALSRAERDGHEAVARVLRAWRPRPTGSR